MPPSRKPIDWELVFRQLAAGHLLKDVRVYTAGLSKNHMSRRAKDDLTSTEYAQYRKLVALSYQNTRKTAVCGTVSGYRYHENRGTMVCRECLDARNADRRGGRPPRPPKARIDWNGVMVALRRGYPVAYVAGLAGLGRHWFSVRAKQELPPETLKEYRTLTRRNQQNSQGAPKPLPMGRPPTCLRMDDHERSTDQVPE